jgi:hypothetical protein
MTFFLSSHFSFSMCDKHSVTKKGGLAEATEETQLTDRNPNNRLALTEQTQSIHIS